MHLDIPKLSFVDSIAKELKTKELVIITGLPGSGKTELAHQIVQALTNIITTKEKLANFQHIHDLKNLDFVINEDKMIFLILDHCIKSWFNKTVIDDMFKKLKSSTKKTKGMVHALVCVPDILLEAFKSSLKSSSFKNVIYDLKDGNIYKDEDWKVIFDSHLKSKNEMMKSLKYQKTDIDAWRQSFIEIQAGDIGKPTLAKLLFEDARNFQNVSNFLQNTHECIMNRISALSESTCVSERRHFVVLVMLMLNNGKLNTDELNKDALADICKSFDVEDVNLFEQLEYPEIGQNAKMVTVHCRETVRVTFDVLWKKRKDLVFKYCDDTVFLELVSLTEGMTDQELIALNDRFQSIFRSMKGKFHVEDHNVASKLLRK
ncbi:uncharacterized protein LOC134238914 [Saccostrea cucullata]|uniref:uncharacterized protein LOC134238914 n=1 Tax=Saccostrea cuccullata TaxID=36930 RepID=UPI002ED1B94C